MDDFGTYLVLVGVGVIVEYNHFLSYLSSYEGTPHNGDTTFGADND